MMRGGPELAEDGLPWPTGSQALIVKAVIGPADQVETAFRAWRNAINIDDHMDGGTYRLLPLLYQRLHDLGIEDPLMGRLKGVYRRAWVETHSLFADVAPTIAKLETAGVRTMLVKGVPLAMSYYKSFATRPMMDLDVVTPIGQRELAFDVLKHMDWTPGDTFHTYEVPDQHGLDFCNAAGRQLDLHWHCLRESPSPEADAWIWASPQPLAFGGVTTQQLRPTAMLLHIVLHGVRSNLEPPIRWIVDAATVIRANPDAIDWADLVQFARSQKLTHRLFLGLDFLATEYGVPVPPSVLRDLKASGVSLIERIENVVYLGPAANMYRPALFPLVDYWRHLRWMNLWAFLKGYGPYLRRRWQLGSAVQIPIRAVRVLSRRLLRAPATSAQS
jgi:hypothetical protein